MKSHKIAKAITQDGNSPHHAMVLCAKINEAPSTVISTIITIICKAPVTKRNVGICNHFICDYMCQCLICDYFCNYLPTSPNWGGFATILWYMCNLYLFHPLMWMLLGLYSFMNKPSWPINCMYNQNLVTNWWTMCIMGMIFGDV